MARDRRHTTSAICKKGGLNALFELPGNTLCISMICVMNSVWMEREYIRWSTRRICSPKLMAVASQCVQVHTLSWCKPFPTNLTQL
eukprot:840576-Amphidinium_carterae.1